MILTPVAVIFIVSIILVCVSIKKIIYVANKCHLFDHPKENRKIHITKTPNLGGVSIYISLIIVSAIFISYNSIAHINYIFVASVIIFTLGLTDDLVGVAPIKKIFAQFLAAFTIAIFANLRFTSFYGIFGIGILPYYISIILTVVFIIFLINAFNLIDGINCLAASVGLLASIVFGICFWKMNQLGFMFLSVAIAGALIGFLYYNKTPAKIFMGDTGSLSLGFIMAVFSINFIESNHVYALINHKSLFLSAPVIVLGLLIIPIFDALRVFTLRVLSNKSPFDADRNHIHHRLLDLNFTHLQATIILITVNTVFVSIVFLFNSLGNETLLLIITLLAVFLNIFSWFLLFKKNNKEGANYNVSSSNLITE